jgi:hypothetical protein
MSIASVCITKKILELSDFGKRRRQLGLPDKLNAMPLQQVAEHWLQPYEALWASALLRLKRGLEALNRKERTVETVSPARLDSLHIEQEVVIAAPLFVFRSASEKRRTVLTISRLSE